MPLYDYLCSHCEHQDDVLGKLVSAPHFKLKGTGWYETDFKNKPKSENSKKDNEKTTKITKTETLKNND